MEFRGNRNEPLLVGVADHEQIGRDRVSHQGGGEPGRRDETRVAGADRVRDQLFHIGERELRIADMDHVAGLGLRREGPDEVARDREVAVDHRAGEARPHLLEQILRRGDDDVAAHDEIRLARRDAGSVELLLPRGDPDMRPHRAALLRQPRHVEDRCPLALERGRRAEQRPDRDHARAADARDQDAVRLFDGCDPRLRQLPERLAFVGRGPRVASGASAAASPPVEASPPDDPIPPTGSSALPFRRLPPSTVTKLGQNPSTQE